MNKGLILRGALARKPLEGYWKMFFGKKRPLKKGTNSRLVREKAQATEAQAARNWSEAARLWAEIACLTPDEINPWLQLGNVQNELGLWHQSLDSFRKAAEVEPGAVTPLIGMAGVYERMGQWDDAYGCWQDCAVAAALNPPADTLLITLHLSLSALRTGRVEQASVLLDRTLKANPAATDIPLYHSLRLELLRLREPDNLVNVPVEVAVDDSGVAFEIASAHLRAGSVLSGLDALNPHITRQDCHPDFLWLASDLNEKLGRWREVLRLCARAIETAPDETRFRDRAFSVALKLGDLKLARIYAGAAGRRDDWNLVHDLMSAYKNDGQGRHARLLCRWLNRKWHHSQWHRLEYIKLVAATLSPDIADKMIREYIADHGTTEESLRTYADIAFLAGNFLDATRRLNFFLEKCGDDEGVSVLLGYALANAVSIDAAEAHFSDVATRQFQSQGALVGLAHMAMRRRDKQATYDRWKRINKIYPEFDIGHVELARSAYEMRQMDLVLSICKERLNTNPDDATVGEFLVWFLLANGRFQEAWQQLAILEQYSASWTVVDLKIQIAAYLGKLDSHLEEILSVVPQSSNRESSKRLYGIIRHLVVVGREDLMPTLINATACDPRMLGWMWPYIKGMKMNDRRLPVGPLADGGDNVQHAWKSAAVRVRADIAEYVRDASVLEIEKIVSKPKHLHPVVHIINKFEQVSGGSELHALDIAERVGKFANVKLWAPEMPHPRFHEQGLVSPIEPAQGKVPYSGVIVFVGVYFDIGDWLAYAQPSRVIFLYNTFEAPMVFDRVREVWERCGVRSELLYCSDMMQHEVDLPGLFEPSPTDIVAFSPIKAPRAADHKFTLGRHSRDVMEKHHVEDWKVYDAVAQAGGTSQILGGTCMEPLFPSIKGMELLPARSGDMVPFLQSLDCYFYRTSTWIEPWGRVVIEAMACGLPVVASRNGGYAQVIEHGVNGFLFDETEEAVALIKALAADPDLRMRIGRAARESMEELLGETSMRRLVSFYLMN